MSFTSECLQTVKEKKNRCRIKSLWKLLNGSGTYVETLLRKLTSETVELEIYVSSFQNKSDHSTNSTASIATVSPINLALDIRTQT